MSLKKDAILIARFIVDFPFKLEKLTMGHMYERKLRSLMNFACEFSRYCPNDRLVNFLLQQSESLKELTVHNSPSERMLRFIVSDLQLTKLELGVEAIYVDDETFADLEKNHHLKDLSFYGDIKFDGLEMVLKIVEQFPALEKLNFFNAEDEDIGLEDFYFIDVFGFQNLNPKMEITVAAVDDNDEFNNIPDVNFYVNASNMQEFQVMNQEHEETKLRVDQLFEDELREAITLEVEAMRIN
jgi:hypothetical protein